MLPFGLAKDLVKKTAVFDSAQSEQVKDKLSDMDYKALVADIANIRGWALSIVLDVIDAVANNALDDLTATEYLDGKLNEALGLDEDDEVDSTLYDVLTANVADALSSLGVSDSTIGDIFSDDADLSDAALEAASETAIANLPDEGEPLDQFYNDFVFGFSDTDLLDEDVDGFDAVTPIRAGSKAAKAKNGALSMRSVNGKKIAYRGVWAIRGGQKTIVNKRLPNQKVKLTAKQKQGLKSARKKAYTANSIRKRVKSWKKGHKMGVYK